MLQSAFSTYGLVRGFLFACGARDDLCFQVTGPQRGSSPGGRRTADTMGASAEISSSLNFAAGSGSSRVFFLNSTPGLARGICDGWSWGPAGDQSASV